MHPKIFDVTVMSCPLSAPELGTWAMIWRRRANGTMLYHTYDILAKTQMQRLINAVIEHAGFTFSPISTGDGDIGWTARRHIAPRPNVKRTNNGPGWWTT